MAQLRPTTANRTLPQRRPNSDYRPREYLTETEVDRLIEAARKRGRNGARDSAAILLAYRHGLRASELASLRWAQIDLRHGGCMSTEPRADAKVSIPYMALSFGHCARYKAHRLMCS
jgi:integrase